MKIESYNIMLSKEKLVTILTVLRNLNDIQFERIYICDIGWREYFRHKIMMIKTGIELR